MSPNRASYYFPSADRARHDGLPCAVVARRDEAAAMDVRVDVVHRRARRERLGGIDAPPGTPELNLRPIVTARQHDASDDGGVSSSATTSACTTPSTRARGFHVKSSSGHRRRRRRRDHHDGGDRTKDHQHQKAAAAAAAEAALLASPSRTKDPPPHHHYEKMAVEAALEDVQGGGARRRRWLYESLVVVKTSSEPERELAESMAEMVAANGIRATEDLEELLACYLALNAAEHHRAVVAAFRRVWSHLARHHHLV
ncbi:hypothetical protein PR202_ga25814 [Eleusine coracana subsp. coracana]|uniref:Transcription repressor n=1 Tax=Eleusine coracana subsp. coracana TaxID=191504 RepID=A0AAV5DBY9_ELECO|nr:hypothetical protein PR202_ga25814 [Eleusine coracana subsp. coracana]